MVLKMGRRGRGIVENTWEKGCVVIYGTCRASLGGWCLLMVENPQEVTVT